MFRCMVECPRVDSVVNMRVVSRPRSQFDLFCSGLNIGAEVNVVESGGLGTLFGLLVVCIRSWNLLSQFDL